jgi:Fanconi anemia group M protein
MENVTIYADKRETNSRILDILKQKCTLVDKQLHVGDYLLSKRVCVERKTAADFISSILDGRLFAQIEEMKKNFTNPLLVIEGNGLFNDERNVHPNAIRGALASIAIDYNVPIIHTANNLETAEMLLTIAKREQLPRKRSFSIRGRKKARSMNDRQEILVSGLPKVNTQTAKKLLKHFGSPEKIFAASEKDLMNVEGIGPKMAKKIRAILYKKYEKSILED